MVVVAVQKMMLTFLHSHRYHSILYVPNTHKKIDEMFSFRMFCETTANYF